MSASHDRPCLEDSPRNRIGEEQLEALSRESSRGKEARRPDGANMCLLGSSVSQCVCVQPISSINLQLLIKPLGGAKRLSIGEERVNLFFSFLFFNLPAP